MVSTSVASIGVMVTALRRPGYFAQTMESWSQVRGVHNLRQFVVALGLSAQIEEQARIVYGCGIPTAYIRMDSPAAQASLGMHRAIGEGIDHLFSDPGVDYAVCGEEDILASDDVLEYFTWAFRYMRDDRRVLVACAHNQGGTGWDDLSDYQHDEDADQQRVRLLPYYNPWIWGISREHWEHVVRPRWDWECNSGTTPGGSDHGYDWNMATRIVPRGKWLCLVPDAARSQNIGEHDGVYSRPDIFLLQHSRSFRRHRDPVDYKLEA